MNPSTFTPEGSPLVFWCAIVVSLLTAGACLCKEGTAWYLRWSAKRRADHYRNSPNVMRQKIKDLQSLVDQFSVRDEAMQKKLGKLNSTIDNLQDEVKRLNDRNKFLSNEVRYEPNALTQHMPSSAPGRWRYTKE